MRVGARMEAPEVAASIPGVRTAETVLADGY